jgi:hypothetical protein
VDFPAGSNGNGSGSGVPGVVSPEQGV